MHCRICGLFIDIFELISEYASPSELLQSSSYLRLEEYYNCDETYCYKAAHQPVQQAQIKDFGYYEYRDNQKYAPKQLLGSSLFYKAKHLVQEKCHDNDIYQIRYLDAH